MLFFPPFPTSLQFFWTAKFLGATVILCQQRTKPLIPLNGGPELQPAILTIVTFRHRIKKKKESDTFLKTEGQTKMVAVHAAY